MWQAESKWGFIWCDKLKNDSLNKVGTLSVNIYKQMFKVSEKTKSWVV